MDGGKCRSRRSGYLPPAGSCSGLYPLQLSPDPWLYPWRKRHNRYRVPQLATGVRQTVMGLCLQSLR
jgi:hypothetical protein